MNGFEEAKRDLEKKAKTISEHIVEKAKIWNRSKYQKAEEYGQQKAVLFSDVETVLGDLQKAWKELLKTLPYKMPHKRGEYAHAVQEWKEKAEKLLEAKK